jgi:exonuclease III
VGSSFDDAARSRPKEFGLKLLLTNTVSLAPKINEIRCCVLDWKPDVACFTETWPHDSINDNHTYIPEYNFISKNRTTGIHGSVGLYIKDSIKFRSLAHLQVNSIEVLWAWLGPKMLPRGVPCVIIGTIYRPPNANDNEMLDYLSTTLTTIEGHYPGCGIFLAGDFNRLTVSRPSTQFRMKQLIRSPTRGDRILDLVLTNLPQIYDKNSVQILPPFGLSDHI